MKISKPLVTCVIVAAVCSLLLSFSAYAQNDTKLSDAEVASVAVVANQIDIDAAEFAKGKSKD